MFFPRLRRQAKWAFAFMVLVFGLGFVFLGVGSGSSGIGDLLQGHFSQLFGGGSSTPSISDLQDKVKKHPKDAKSWHTLADQLQAKGRTDEAIKAYEQYVKLRPKNANVIEQLGALQIRRGTEYATAYQQAYFAQQEANPAAALAPPSNTKLGQALGNDPITNALSTASNGAVTRAFSGMQASYSGAVATYKKLVALRPNDADAQESLGFAAENAANTKVALAAYTRYLKLRPDATDAATIRQKIKGLKAQLHPAKPVPKKKHGR